MVGGIGLLSSALFFMSCGMPLVMSCSEARLKGRAPFKLFRILQSPIAAKKVRAGTNREAVAREGRRRLRCPAGD